jgi:hypothetical protein
MAMRNRWISRHLRSLRDILGDAALGSHPRTAANSAVIGDPDLPTQDTILLDFHAAPETDLRAEQRAGHNLHIMPYLHEIIDFYALPDMRHSQRGAVDTTIRSDLGVRLDHHPSGRWDPLPTCAVLPKSKASASNYCTRCHYGPVAENGAHEDRRAGSNPTASAYFYIQADVAEGFDSALAADGRSRTNINKGANPSGWIHHRRVMNRSARVNANGPFCLARGKKPEEQTERSPHVSAD